MRYGDAGVGPIQQEIDWGHENFGAFVEANLVPGWSPEKQITTSSVNE